MNTMDDTTNPPQPAQTLKRSLDLVEVGGALSQETIDSKDSAAPNPHKDREDGFDGTHDFNHEVSNSGEPASKRVRLTNGEPEAVQLKADTRDKVKGVASIKEEYLVKPHGNRRDETASNPLEADDAAESRLRADDRDGDSKGGGKKKTKKERGQNTGRQFGFSGDTIKLCNSLANSAEFTPKECKWGDRCNMSHDLRKYLKEGKRKDLATFNAKCPVWEVNGRCYAGWKCRFVSSHMEEIEREDGRKELVLVIDPARATTAAVDDDENRAGVFNVVSAIEKLDLSKRKTKTKKADEYTEWLERDIKELEKVYHKKKHEAKEEVEDNRAQYREPPFQPSEKRRLYFGPDTPVLAPLTTQGNLPFRRLCVEFGAQLTYSEMAMTVPLVQGGKSEWALMKAHESEITPPNLTGNKSVVQGYDNSKDLRFGAQISANKPWQAFKATEVLTTLLPHLRLIDLNCGCPIDLVFRQGAGSALLDAPSKLEKMIRGMNAVSTDVPITAKIRMGTKDNRPTATKIIERLAFGSTELQDRLGPPGCAAITLHGRSRQQRYTRSADWGYIAECAALIKSFNGKRDMLSDTTNEPDPRHLSSGGKLYFIGNGDCYSHIDYYDHIEKSGVDSVMLARGALIKPWLFEEIQKGQYLDKSASERLGYVEKFARYGLEAWGSDEVGVGHTRRFLLEWLSFAHRYVPVGILAHLPPSLQDRPPAYKGRNDLETLLASDNYKDWIKISEMFLGPAGPSFQFLPKHKSNSYEIEAEG